MIIFIDIYNLILNSNSSKWTKIFDAIWRKKKGLGPHSVKTLKYRLMNMMVGFLTKEYCLEKFYPD